MLKNVFAKAQHDFLKCLVSATTQIWSIYQHQRGKKQKIFTFSQLKSDFFVLKKGLKSS